MKISPNGKEEFEGDHKSTVQIPPIFTYYSNVVLAEYESSPVIWHVPTTEYVWIAVLCLLADAHDGVVGVAELLAWTCRCAAMDVVFLFCCYPAFVARSMMSPFLKSFEDVALICWFIIFLPSIV